MNGKNETVGVYCGEDRGNQVDVTGNYVVLIFHTDSKFQRKGFFLYVEALPLGKYN